MEILIFLSISSIINNRLCRYKLRLLAFSEINLYLWEQFLDDYKGEGLIKEIRPLIHCRLVKIDRSFLGMKCSTNFLFGKPR